MAIQNKWNKTTEADMSSKTYSPRLYPGEGLRLSGGSIESHDESAINELVKQNIKMILLTIPGERIMFPEFGVGLRTYLFEMPTPALINVIKSKVKEQLNLYSVPILIQSLDISFEEQMMYFRMSYIVSQTKAADRIELDLLVSPFNTSATQNTISRGR